MALTGEGGAIFDPMADASLGGVAAGETGRGDEARGPGWEELEGATGAGPTAAADADGEADGEADADGDADAYAGGATGGDTRPPAPPPPELEPPDLGRVDFGGFGGTGGIAALG